MFMDNLLFYKIYVNMLVYINDFKHLVFCCLYYYYYYYYYYISSVRNPYKISVGKPEDKRTLLKPSCRMMDNIKMYCVLEKDFKLRGL